MKKKKKENILTKTPSIFFYLLLGDTGRLLFPPVMAASVTRFCMLIGDIPALARMIFQVSNIRVIIHLPVYRFFLDIITFKSIPIKSLKMKGGKDGFS